MGDTQSIPGQGEMGLHQVFIHFPISMLSCRRYVPIIFGEKPQLKITSFKIINFEIKFIFSHTKLLKV